MQSSGKLSGGFDDGALLVDGAVHRRAGFWSPAIHALLAHVRARGFTGVPTPLGFDEDGREVLTFLPGETVGSQRPWPAWVHSDRALHDVGVWLREYHRAVADFVPPPDACWREGGTWAPGMVIAHNDPGPYNVVWNETGLVGFYDWDMAGPAWPAEDLAWFAFSWVPLHARHVVEAEGFTEFDRRGERLDILLDAYGWTRGADALLAVLRDVLTKRIDVTLATASRGDATYRQIVSAGAVDGLRQALRELDTAFPRPAAVPR